MSKKYLKVPYHKEEKGMLVLEVEENFDLKSIDDDKFQELMIEAKEQAGNGQYIFDKSEAFLEDEEVI
jgi:hypothetical protein